MAPATLAMYSLGNGFLAWPLIGLLLIWSDSWEQLKGKIWPLAAWCGVFVLLSALYMIGYHSSAKTDEERAAYFAGFIPILHYVLNLLGNYFAYVGRYPSHVTSTTLSTIMLAMYLGAVGYFIWICRRGRGEVCRWMMVWLVVGGFAVLSALMAGLIRAGLGIGQAESSRYVAFSIYLPVALVNLIPLLIADARLHATRLAAAIFPPATNAVLAALLLFLYLLSIQVSVHDMGIVHKTLIIARVDLQLLKLFPDHPLLLKCLTFDPKQTLVMAQELNQIGYINPPLILSDDASRILEVTTAPPGSLGNIKNIDQQGEEIRAYGYATQPFASSPADAVFVTYDNAAGRPIILALAEMAVLFPGQADDGSDPELVATQWGVVFPTSRLPPDLKHIRIRAWQLDGRTGKAFEMNGANAATGMSRN
jgi:hypothetical protein